MYYKVTLKSTNINQLSYTEKHSYKNTTKTTTIATLKKQTKKDKDKFKQNKK